MNPRERMAQELAKQAGTAPQHIDVMNLDAVELPPLLDLPRAEPETFPVGSQVSSTAAVEDDEPVALTTNQLTRAVQKALNFLEDTLDRDVSRMDTDEARAMGIQLSAAQTLINTQAKVDDTMLRARQLDTIPKLLELIKEAKKSSPRQIEAQALEAAE